MANCQKQNLRGSKAQAAQVSNYQGIITPEIAELIELYRDTERYSERCYNFVERSMSNIAATDEMILANFNERFGKQIEQIEASIESRMIGAIIDQISIYNV